MRRISSCCFHTHCLPRSIRFPWPDNEVLYCLFLSLLFCFAFIGLKAQNHGTIKAVVLDSATSQPVQLATVSILDLRDSSLVAYTVTGKDGTFTLRVTPKTHTVEKSSMAQVIS